MGLQSIQYLVFLVVAAAVYLHLPHKGQAPFLLGASWVFYALAPGRMLPVTLAIAAFSYLCGLGIGWKTAPIKPLLSAWGLWAAC